MGQTSATAADMLREAFRQAVAASMPNRALSDRFALLPVAGRTAIVAIGKAAYPMAERAAALLGEAAQGLVLTRYGHRPEKSGLPHGLELIEAAHPLPDDAGTDAARKIMALVQGLGADDRLIFLASGGGSALLALPAKGVTLSDKRAVVADLLASGASIGEINCVRAHLSAIKGGRLAVAAWPARVETYCISDVVGDDPALIASGPTVPHRTTLTDAREVLRKYDIAVSARIEKALSDPENALPSPDHPVFSSGQPQVIATNATARNAAADFLAERGYAVVDLGDIEGDAAEIGAQHAALARDYCDRQDRVAIVSGGECTVRMGSGTGRGGPNGEYLMALGAALGGAPGIHALAADTDGIDGNADCAGAVLYPDTLERARGAGIDWNRAMSQKCSHDVFGALGDAIVTGPTMTNVNDLRIVLVDR